MPPALRRLKRIAKTLTRAEYQRRWRAAGGPQFAAAIRRENLAKRNSMTDTTITEAELRAAVDFLTALGVTGRVLDTASLRVEALSAGIACDTLWAAAQRLGGVPGWATSTGGAG
jgi:hypothetical protein